MLAAARFHGGRQYKPHREMKGIGLQQGIPFQARRIDTRLAVSVRATHKGLAIGPRLMEQGL